MDRQLKNIAMGTVISLLLIVASSACKQHYAPKPKAYYRISFPERNYSTFDSLSFPYQFEYPSYSKVEIDHSANTENYWLNMEFESFNGTLHISYKDIKGNFDELIEDSRRLVYKHSIKADAINERMYINDDSKVYGILYEISGDAASSIQFFATDSTAHFLRGSLYFNVTPNKDSLAPVVNFVKEDIFQMMETLKWNN